MLIVSPLLPNELDDVSAENDGAFVDLPGYSLIAVCVEKRSGNIINPTVLGPLALRIATGQGQAMKMAPSNLRRAIITIRKLLEENRKLQNQIEELRAPASNSDQASPA